MSGDNEDNLPEHPALKNFSRAREQVKHVSGATLKGGLMGAVIGGIAIPLLIAGVVSIGLLALGPVGWVVGALGGGAALGSGSALTIAAAVAAKSALIGAAAGGAIGLARGACNADDVADDEAEKRIAAYERREVREERMAMVGQRREQQRLAMARQAQTMGLSPGLNLPFGPGGNERQV